MKVFVLLAVLACASAKPQIFYNSWPFGGVTYSAAPAVTYSAPAVTYTAAAPAVTYTAAAPVAVPIATKTQYHAQDEFGQASFGYAHPGQARAEFRDAFGGVQGSYAYIGADGKEVRVNYVADAVNGFRVQSNALPVAPAVPEVPALIAPAPVEDTPEVAEAKAAHLKAVEEAKIRNDEAEKKDAAEEAATAAPEAAQSAETQPEKSRRKRDLVATYAAGLLHHNTLVHAPALTYAAAPAVTYTAAPAVTYAAAPALTYAAAPAVTYSAAPAVREATLTKVVNTPGHAVSYRVD